MERKLAQLEERLTHCEKNLDVLINRFLREIVTRMRTVEQTLADNAGRVSPGSVEKKSQRRRMGLDDWKKVMGLKSQGFSDKKIASELGISLSTVRNVMAWPESRVRELTQQERVEAMLPKDPSKVEAPAVPAAHPGQAPKNVVDSFGSMAVLPDPRDDGNSITPWYTWGKDLAMLFTGTNYPLEEESLVAVQYADGTYACMLAKDVAWGSLNVQRMITAWRQMQYEQKPVSSIVAPAE